MIVNDSIFIRQCYGKFKQSYDNCQFIGIPTCKKHGGFGYSRKFFDIAKKIGDINDTEWHGKNPAWKKDEGSTDEASKNVGNTRIIFKDSLTESAHSDNRDSIAVFLSNILQSPKVLGDKYCDFFITYLDKRYKAGFIYYEYDGLEDYYVSKDEFICSLIPKNLHLSDSELGRLIREEMGREPLKYNNECATFLTSDEKKRCRELFQKYFKI